MQEMYYLFLVLPGENFSNFLANKHFVDCGSLMELDEITSAYVDAQDLGDDLNPTTNRVEFLDAFMISERDYRKLEKNGWRHDFVHKVPALFQEDRNFFEQQTRDEKVKYYYDKELIYYYKNYLLQNRLEICDSLVRAVILGIDIDASISIPDMERVFLAYYNKRSYRKMRDTYFELKKYGIIKKVSQGRTYRKMG